MQRSAYARATLVGALLAALVALATWLVWRTRAFDPPRAADRALATTGSTPADEHAAELEAAPHAQPVEFAASADATRADDASAEQRAAALPDGAPRATFEVLAIAAGDKRALPGAEFRYADFVGWPSARWMELRDVTRIDERLRHVPIVRADANGHARFELPRGPALLCARHENLWGWVMLLPNAPPPTAVYLEPAGAVVVRVLDVANAPRAHAPLELSVPRESRAGRVDTDADGLARFEHVVLLPHNVSGAKGCKVRARLVAETAVEQAFDVDEHVAEPLELHLPACGSVDVRVLDVDGAAANFAGSLSLRPGSGPEQAPFFQELPGQVLERLKDGCARFELVAIEQDLWLSVSRPGTNEPHVERVRAPSRDGEAIELVVRLGVERPVVQARVVFDTGAPLASTQVRCWLLDAGAESDDDDAFQPTTDAHGVLRCELPQAHVGRSFARLQLAVGSGTSPVEWRGEIALAGALRAGLNDLGTLVLERAPLVVAGAVVDRSGAPIADAYVLLDKLTGDGDARPLQRWTMNQELYRWAAPISASDGHFEVRTFRTAPAMQVRAVKPEWSCNGVPFESGATDVRVVMWRACSLRGRVIADPWLAPSMLKASLGGAALGEGTTTGTSVRDDGTFEWRNLEPGLYTVSILPRAGGDALASVAAIDVREGEACSDTRLDPIDLRGVERCVLHVVGPNGPWTGELAVGTGACGAPPRWQRGNGPEFAWCSAGVPRCVRVLAPGMRELTLEPFDGEATIELAAGWPLAIELDDPTRLPGGDVHVRVALVRDDATLPMFDEPAAEFDARGRARLLAPAAGAYALAWVARNESTRVTARERAAADARIDVRDGAAEQHFGVRADDPALQRAIAQTLR